MKRAVFFLLGVWGIALLTAGQSMADLIRVDSVVVSASSLKEAQSAAKIEAMKRALQMLGNREIPGEVRDEILQRAGKLVTIRRALNTRKVKGLYTPVFFCTVDSADIDAIIERYRKPTFKALKRPQINIAVVFRSLPARFAGEKAFFLDRVNNLLEQHFGGAGFRIGTAPSAMLGRLNQKDPQAVFHAFVRYSTEVNYLLFGAMDLLDDDIRSEDQGRYFKARVGLTLRFFSVSSNDEVSFSRDVYGVGENEGACIVNAMRNCAKAITEKLGSHRIIEDWNRKLQEGFEYSLMFCGSRGKRWIRPLRRALRERGEFISRSRGDNVTDIYRFHANPGQFVFPSVDFEDLLMDLDGVEGVRSEVTLVGDRLYFVFGDSPECFDRGFDASEKTVTPVK
jgi:hypothetical protein